MKTILQARTAYGKEENISLGGQPDKCPLCHVSVNPVDLKMLFIVENFGTPHIERPFQCPNKKCSRLFIALYFRKQVQDGVFYFHSCVPVEMTGIKQSETISKISPDFCAIYEQAHKAEQHGLLLVAGPGYRKALEFLVKDYIISRFTESDTAKLAADKAGVEKTLLGSCIKTHIKSEQIKEIAKRAAWLGNDETHYVRKWEDKDLKDLKKLIALTLHWIEMDTLTVEVIADMPEAKT